MWGQREGGGCIHASYCCKLLASHQLSPASVVHGSRHTQSAGNTQTVSHSQQRFATGKWIYKNNAGSQPSVGKSGNLFHTVPQKSLCGIALQLSTARTHSVTLLLLILSPSLLRTLYSLVPASWSHLLNKFFVLRYCPQRLLLEEASWKQGGFTDNSRVHVWMNRETRTYLGDAGGRTVLAELGPECITGEVHWNIQLKKGSGEKRGLCEPSAQSSPKRAKPDSWRDGSWKEWKTREVDRTLEKPTFYGWTGAKVVVFTVILLALGSGTE